MKPRSDRHVGRAQTTCRSPAQKDDTAAVPHPASMFEALIQRNMPDSDKCTINFEAIASRA